MAKNSRAMIKVLIVIASVASIVAIPQPAGPEKVPTSGNPDNDGDSIDLPFLQFKNGGIRVNFAGYHAEAGLGGLLGGSDTGGGLYASAGTPWGPSASAGLGGALGGADGTAKGGLHARAGLGNGRPEAAAGLGGSLDGSASPGNRARGGLYALTRPGTSNTAEESFNQPGPAPGSNRVTNVGNIQPIPSPARQKVILAKSGVEEPSTTLEFKLPVTSRNGASSYDGEVEDPKTDAILVNPNDPFSTTEVRDPTEIVYPGRRYYRKLLRGRPIRPPNFYKYLSTNTGPVGEIPIGSSTSNHPDGIVARQANDNQTHAEDRQLYGVPPKRRGTIFDDIFNIPISTLAAVNQLLNNKAG